MKYVTAVKLHTVLSQVQLCPQMDTGFGRERVSLNKSLSVWEYEQLNLSRIQDFICFLKCQFDNNMKECIFSCACECMNTLAKTMLISEPDLKNTMKG